MSVPARTLAPTPAQTIGPFFADGVSFAGMDHLVRPHDPGAILLDGVVLDGAGAPVPDALVELAQADADGSLPTGRGVLVRGARGFSGFGRSCTDADGRFAFWTREPGALGEAAPFFAVLLHARGLAETLHTRIYVPGDPVRLDADPLLASLALDERATLIATRSSDGGLEHALRMQGDRETVFLAF